MATIQFEDGTKVQFEGNPTSQDIEDVAKEHGLLGGGYRGYQGNQLEVAPQEKDTRSLFERLRDKGTQVGETLGRFLGGNILGEKIQNYRASQEPGSLELQKTAPELYQKMFAGPTTEQLVGDIGHIGTTIAGASIPGAGSIGGRLAQTAGFGASTGLFTSLKENATPSSAGLNTLLGGTTGLALGGLGEGLSALVNKFPVRIVQKAIPGIDRATGQEAIQNLPLGSVDFMRKSSSGAVKSLGGQIDAILSHPEHTGKVINSDDIVNQVLKQFPNSEYTKEEILGTIKDLIPEQAKLVNKLQKGDISLLEGNTIRKSLDRAVQSVFTSLNRPPEKKAIGAAVANALRGSVQSQAEETVPIFNNLQKEINLRNALSKLGKRLDKRSFVGLHDILFGGVGAGIGGLPGAAIGVGLSEASRNPAVNLGMAKFLNVLKRPASAVTPFVRAGRVPFFSLLRGLTNQEGQGQSSQ